LILRNIFAQQVTDGFFKRERENMKNLIQKLIRFKIGRALLWAFIIIFIVPIQILGRSIFYFSKILRAISYVLMFNIYSAKEEITDFSIWLEVKDVLK
jgi:hypothetical protein